VTALTQMYIVYNNSNLIITTTTKTTAVVVTLLGNGASDVKSVYYGRMPPTIFFYRCSLDLLYSFFHCIVSKVAWPSVTKLCHMFDDDPVYKIRSEICVAPPFPSSPPPPRNVAAQNIKISAWFHITSGLDREYLQNATKHRQSENGVANDGHSNTGELNSVYFGP